MSYLSEVEGLVDLYLNRLGPRISREELYLAIAQLLRTQSTCLRGKVGAVLVLERRIIATGYNGAPPGMPHCFELGCLVDENSHVTGCQRTLHAEANVIAFAARHGVCTRGATLYCTHGPCLKCAQLILAAGIRGIVFQTPYRLSNGLELISEHNAHCFKHEKVKVVHYNEAQV